MKMKQGQLGEKVLWRREVERAGGVCECVSRWAVMVLVGMIVWGLIAWAQQEDALYAAEEEERVIGDRWSVIGGEGECRHETQKCQGCGRQIMWVPLVCPCMWPPVRMDEQNWSAARAAVERAGSVPLASNMCLHLPSDYTPVIHLMPHFMNAVKVVR